MYSRKHTVDFVYIIDIVQATSVWCRDVRIISWVAKIMLLIILLLYFFFGGGQVKSKVKVLRKGNSTGDRKKQPFFICMGVSGCSRTYIRGCANHKVWASFQVQLDDKIVVNLWVAWLPLRLLLCSFRTAPPPKKNTLSYHKKWLPEISSIHWLPHEGFLEQL